MDVWGKHFSFKLANILGVISICIEQFRISKFSLQVLQLQLQPLPRIQNRIFEIQLAGQFYLFIQTPLDRRGMASCPSVSAHPANHIRCSSNIAIADHFPSKTFSFKHHLTGEAWPACRAILPFHHTQNVCKLERKMFSPNIHASV